MSDAKKLIGFRLISFLILFGVVIYGISDIQMDGIDQSRLSDPDKAGEESLFIIWENGSDLNFNLDLRIATISISIILLISIFATIYLQQTGGNKDE